MRLNISVIPINEDVMIRKLIFAKGCQQKKTKKKSLAMAPKDFLHSYGPLITLLFPSLFGMKREK